MMRIMISMMCCLIVLGCQDGVKIVRSVPTESIPPQSNNPVPEILESVEATGWLPVAAYFILLAAVCWLTWREFRGSARKSD